MLGLWNNWVTIYGFLSLLFFFCFVLFCVANIWMWFKKSGVAIWTYSNIKRQQAVFVMDYASINTRCQYCIIISPKHLPFSMKADVLWQTLFLLLLLFVRCSVEKNEREQSLQCLLQILHHYNVLHLSLSLMQLSLSAICGNFCNLKSISGFYSTALPHYHSSFWLRESDSLSECLRE